uniref:vasodilator-stimulated phosphoprotein-like n=1 Tax=Agelaius phoeniceus TaxID=39638 RepID=UPI0023ED55DD|nr:vasodilator-stimulated phosphoprotein-like [Agelaius phoeniceus]
MRCPARPSPLPGRPPPPRVPQALSGCAAGPGRSAGAAAVPARPRPQTALRGAAGGAGPAAAAAPCGPSRPRPRAMEIEAAAAAQDLHVKEIAEAFVGADDSGGLLFADKCVDYKCLRK